MSASKLGNFLMFEIIWETAQPKIYILRHGFPKRHFKQKVNTITKSESALPPEWSCFIELRLNPFSSNACAACACGRVVSQKSIGKQFIE